MSFTHTHVLESDAKDKRGARDQREQDKVETLERSEATAEDARTKKREHFELGKMLAADQEVREFKAREQERLETLSKKGEA
eukprot:m51a1_g3792 hypothetical protein (82) ;mRNA; f:187106-187351